MNLKFERALKEDELIKKIIDKLGWNYLNTTQIKCVKSYNSVSRKKSRVFGTQKIFTDVFKITPGYVIELIEPNFSKLSEEDKVKELVLKLMFIPKTFSGETKKFLKININEFEKQINKVLN